MDNKEMMAEAKRLSDYLGDTDGGPVMRGLSDALEAAEAELTRERGRVEEWRRIAATNRREADDAKAELTRRDTVIANALAAIECVPLMDDRYGTHVDRKVLFDILAAAPVSLETVNTTLAQVIADALGWDWESAPGVPSPVEAVSDVAAAVEQHLSLEAVSPSAERVRDFCDGWYSARIHRDIAAATHSPDLVRLGISDEAVKAETTTEWNAVRQDATGELWDVYEPFDSREDAERVAAEWRSNNEPGDDPVVVVERAKGVAPGEWQIVSSEETRG